MDLNDIRTLHIHIHNTTVTGMQKAISHHFDKSKFRRRHCDVNFDSFPARVHADLIMQDWLQANCPDFIAKK